MCDKVLLVLSRPSVGKSLFKNEQKNNLLTSVQNCTVGFCVNLQELRSMCVFFLHSSRFLVHNPTCVFVMSFNQFVLRPFHMANHEPKSDVPSLTLQLASQALLASLFVSLWSYVTISSWYIGCQYNTIDCRLAILSPVGTRLLGCDLWGCFFSYLIRFSCSGRSGIKEFVTITVTKLFSEKPENTAAGCSALCCWY